ncbi:MAG: transposase [Chloroflexi bacterium]|nr:transposase [Chloroflexota bacterium]
MGFRQTAYEALGTGRDAFFELGDAVLLTPSADSFAELSLSPVFRRQWSSVYEALQDGRPDREALLRLYALQIPTTGRPVFVGDHTAWPRLSARTLRDRTIEHHPTKIWGNKPITIGQGYSTVAFLPDTAQNWTLPLLHERIESTTDPIQKGADQLRRVRAVLQIRPISLWDSEYGCAPFVKATADIDADKVVRIRPNRCLWGCPPPYRGWGRPAQHGAKFKPSDPQTWPEPAQTLHVIDEKLGPVVVQLFENLHFREAPKQPFLLIRIHRVDAKGTRREPKDLFIAWIGETPPPLEDWWPLYLRRFAIECWYHFAKSRLHWTLPRLKTPEQCQRWSDLMPLLTWQVWMAKSIVTDCPLPWQKPQTKLTPKRAIQSIGGILTQIGTPARMPKPRGKSPGWPKGWPRTKAPRYEVVKKSKKRQT